ncbi:uncharacterized protein LOC128726586 [Anopheles nili]|uniref:uncharacterized protein LOC128726586 n=1 Tax=Anopheles nili TaxID=185578 RepID=UPI00237A96FF|nr:uncharacterized protein LOC128726586 [Anopheles nili]
MSQNQQTDEVIETLTEYYDPIAILFSSVNYNTENLTIELRRCGVKYNQLSGLVKEDLRLMGMTNDEAIKEILDELSSLSNQDRLYDSVLCNEFIPEKYSETVLKHSVEHLELMNNMLSLIQLKLQASFPNNVLLEDNVYASQFCLQLCDKISEKIGDIQAECTETKFVKPKNFRQRITLPILLATGAVVVVLVWQNKIHKFW